MKQIIFCLIAVLTLLATIMTFSCTNNPIIDERLGEGGDSTTAVQDSLSKCDTALVLDSINI